MDPAQDRSTARTRILVVEDERIVALDLSRTLEGLGYGVCGSVSSGAAALALMAEVRPDLALVDVNLEQGEDGIEVAARLRDQFRVPVVFLTGAQDDRTLQRALRAQPLGYVHKPVQTARLQSAIQLALDKWRTEDDLRRSNVELSTRMHSLEERCAELALMNEMGELFLIGETQAEIAAVAQRFGRKVFSGNGVVYLFAPDRSLLDHFAGWGPDEAAPVLAVQDCLSLRRGRAHRYLVADGLRCGHLKAGAAIGSLCAPLVAGGDTIGMLSVDMPDGVDPVLAELKLQLATAFGQQIAVAVANLRLRERLKRESIEDSLTGLFNRRYLDLSLARELRLAARKQQSLSVVLFDVDHFKKLNDTYGHAAGDIVLRELGGCLRGLVRLYDIPCRYGGEEIAVLLPGTVLSEGAVVAEKLRVASSALSIHSGVTGLPRITLSAGVAAFPDHGSDAFALLSAADAALYEAKQAGRDRVAVAPPRESVGPSRAVAVR